MTLIDTISEKIGNKENNIRIIDDFITNDDRLAILEYCKKMANSEGKTAFYSMPMSSELKHLYLKYTRKMIQSAEDFYNDICPITKYDLPNEDNDPSWSDHHTFAAGILCHPPKSFMHPHIDVVGFVQEEGYNMPDPESKWSGHLSSVIYLNDDYEGGELYFKDRGVSIKPKAGQLIGFPGNRHYKHGVTEIIGKDRFTLSSWLRFEEANGKELYSYGIEK